MHIPHVLTKLSGKTDFTILVPVYIKVEYDKRNKKKKGNANKNVDNANSDFSCLIPAWKDHFLF